MSDLKARLTVLRGKWQKQALAWNNMEPMDHRAAEVFRWCEADLAALLVGEEPHPRMFPIQDGPAIPWDVIARFWIQCEHNHDQTVEVLAQRGGLGVGEALPILMGEDYYRFWEARGGYDDKKKPEYINELLALVQQRQKQFAVGEEPAADPWRCFHCDEVFTDRTEAEEHFGTCETRVPACRLGSEDVKQLRALEALNAKLHRELDTLENDARLWHESEADRIRRIGNVQWWQELDSREGERLALLEQIAQLKASLPAPPGAASPQLQEKDQDDLARVDKGTLREGTGSTASTNGR